MIRRVFELALVPALITTVSFAGMGCAKPTVVGKWQGSMTAQGQTLQTTLDLKQDGTMTQTSTTPIGPITATGTYKAEGSKLTMMASDLKVNGKPLAPAVAAMIPKDQTNRTADFKLDGDTLALTDKGNTVTLTRVKEDAAK